MKISLKNNIKRVISAFLGITILTTTFTTASLPVTDIPAYATDNKAIAIVDDGVASNIEDEQSSSVYFGNYKQSSDGSGGFDNEPIKWRVLKNNITNKTLFLLADKNLDCKQYSYSSCTWETCTLRKWLNGLVDNPYTDNFLEAAFSSEEQGSVATTEVVNPENPDYHIPGGNNTSDRVFILSVAEAKDSNYGFTGDDKRISANTDYARYQNAYDDHGNGLWWLRTPGQVGQVTGVLYNGIVHTGGADVTENTIAVRPAFNLDLSSIILTSAAESGKDADSTLGTLKQVVDYAGSDWKLTLHDTSRDGTGKFTASAATGATLNMAEGYTSWTVPVTYSGAETGTNEYVSAILTDSSGVALYYGHIANDSAASSDTGVDVTIPTGLSAGTYTLNIFNEQCNGDKKTDYASAFSTIDITIGGQDTDKTISGLCTGPIGVPDEPETKDTAWSGSYVWYGSTAPNKYRVLAPSTETYNDSPTMLLDCDTILERKRFDNNSCEWAASELNGYLNGDGFLNNNDKFTVQERNAIAESTVNGHALATGDYADDWFENYVGLGGEKIFVLDYEDVMKPSYGYYKKSGYDGSNWEEVDNHIKKEADGSPGYWWLRSRYHFTSAGSVYGDGRVDIYLVDDDDVGVSPAFNINLSSVIFSSLIPDKTNEYKLTVKDTNMTIAQTGGQDITRAGNVVTVPYTITGGTPTRVSVLLTNTPYSEGRAATTGYTYQKLNVTTWGTSGTGTFTLPDAYADKTCGTDYHAYILAEDVNAGTATDYASIPVSITIPAPTYTVTMSNDGHGTAEADPTSGETDTQVTITATPAINYHFKQWEVVNGGVTLSSTTTNPATFVIGTANVEIKAIFEHVPLGTGKNLQLGAGLFENGETVYYGSKTDAIEWKIIGFNGNGVASESGNATLISSGVLGTTKFSDSEGKYENSILHTAINNILSGRFTDKEDTVMPDRTLQGKTDRGEAYASAVSNYIWGTDLSGQKLWPLSTAEAKTLKTNLSDIAVIGSKWWLRSPGNEDNKAAFVPGDGYVFCTGDIVNGYEYGVRPAFNINLSSIILASAAIGGKDAGNTTGTLKEIADYSGSEWKLTILDSGRNGFTASAGTGATLSETEGYNSWTVPVTCTDDPSGTNEHISAILTNSAGVALYYGHIQDSVTIPTGLSVGNYTLNVFSEQCNGDKKTDYSSPISKIELSVRSSHNHSYSSSVIKEPTCTETGTRRYTCSCGYSYTETIPALGHDYVGKITKYASAQEDGIMTYTCSRCHDSYTESIPKHEPTLEEGIEEIKQLIGELEGDDSEHKVEVKVETVEKEDGTVETVVTVGDEEILKITTDEDGEEEIESNIWSIGGDGNFTYTGVAIKPEILVFDGLKRLSLGSDFTVSYKNNVNAGAKAEAKVGFRGGYSETSEIKTNFTIDQADLEKNTTAPAMIIAANGKAQKPIPEITITESGKSISKNDLKYTYLDSEKKEVSVIKDAGDYTVEAVPKKTGGNLTGKITVPITVTGDKTKLLSNGKVNFAKKSYVYTGKPIIPDKDTYSLTIDGTKLTEGKDYTLTVSKNIEPGKATMIFTAADGNEDGYVGSIKAVFTITKGKELKPAGDGSDFKYTYEENAPFAKGGAKPEVTVKDGDKTLTKDVDYKVSYDKNKKITEGNTAVMTVTGKGNYKGKVTLYYAVVPQDIASLAGGIEVQDKAVSSKGYKNPKVTITDVDGKKLKKNTDFELSDDYTEPDKDGNVTVTIKGKGAYTGTVPVTYRYLEAAALIDKVNASKIADKTYTGSPIRLTKKEAAKLLYTGKGKDINYLTWGEDFEIVRYENNTKTGTAKVILRGIGTHGGTRTLTFKIKSAKKTGLKIIISKLFNK